MGRNGTVQLRVVGESPRPPRRQRNIDRRPREYLTPAEVETLIATACKRNRYGHRDATMILIAYRHGLRVSELCRLEWSQIDFASGLLHVARLKGSISTTHPLRGVELRALRRLKREQEPSRHVWITERSAPMTAGGFRQMLRRTSGESGLGFPVHPHMLRHACGYKIATMMLANTRVMLRGYLARAVGCLPLRSLVAGHPIGR
jgi:type 1 fimbriae regulatory protein FimB/type 1 fimbriae regulatory protein FimE